MVVPCRSSSASHRSAGLKETLFTFTRPIRTLVSEFPYGFPGVSWDVRPPAFLRDVVAGEPWEIGVLEQQGKRWFVVRDRPVTVKSEVSG